MSIGICSWAFSGSLRRNRQISELASLAKDFGFSSLEGAFHPRGVLGAEGQLPERQLAVPIRSLATLELHRFSLTDSRPRRRAYALEVVSQMIDCAKLWGIPTLSFSLGALNPDQNLGSFLEKNALQFNSLLNKAAEAGCQIALENLPGHCLVKRQAMAQALDGLGPQVSVCLDIANALLDPPVVRWIEEFGPRITKIHLSDGKVNAEALEPALPGRGEVPWKEVRKKIEHLKDRVDIFVEAPLPRGVPEKIFLQNIAEALQDVWLT